MRRKAPKALRAAFPYTLPVLAGYMFLGIAFGVFMTAEGVDYLIVMQDNLEVLKQALQSSPAIL